MLEKIKKTEFETQNSFQINQETVSRRCHSSSRFCQFGNRQIYVSRASNFSSKLRNEVTRYQNTCNPQRTPEKHANFKIYNFEHVWLKQTQPEQFSLIIRRQLILFNYNPTRVITSESFPRTTIIQQFLPFNKRTKALLIYQPVNTSTNFDKTSRSSLKLYLLYQGFQLLR